MPTPLSNNSALKMSISLKLLQNTASVLPSFVRWFVITLQTIIKYLLLVSYLQVGLKYIHNGKWIRYKTDDNYPQINMLQNINFKASPANTTTLSQRCHKVGWLLLWRCLSLEMNVSPASFDNVMATLKLTF